MAEFACKPIKLSEIVKCTFGMTKTDYNILLFLVEKDEEKLSVMDIAKQMNLDRTTVQKSIKRLSDLELVKKFQTNFSSGGYAYSYSIIDKFDIKQKLSQSVDSWSESIKDEIRKW